MKKIIILTILILGLVLVVQSQQLFCADSSVRIKYIFGNQGGTLYNNPDTSGFNIFTGGFTEGSTGGIALLKTTWGDSMIWAKKIYMPGNSVNSFDGPNGTILCTGSWGNPASLEFLLTKLQENGVVQWARRYKLSLNHIKYNPGNWGTKNILIANNAIYFNAIFNNYYNIVAKIDLNGNLLWSKSFTRSSGLQAAIIDAPVFLDNQVVFISSLFDPQSLGQSAKLYNVITKIDDINGNIIQAFCYKSNIDSIGLFTRFFKSHIDKNFSVTGLLGIFDINSNLSLSDIVFNTSLDSNLDLIHNYYYKNNVLLDPQDSYFDFNNQKHHAFLSQNAYNSLEKYFVSFDKLDEVFRTRKLTIQLPFSSTTSRTSVNLDDKQNVHFLFHYPQNSKLVTEYARISDFAPSGTPGCFGKDTSILTQYPFTLIKSPFTWQNVTSDVLISNPVVFTEDTAIVTKELVCKLVSYCDSVHISGPTTVCINQPVRYTVTKNAACLKSLQWNIDTTIATIVSTEADTAITLSFKQVFTGYIHAAIYNCVVTDSFFVTVTAPLNLKLINRDSLLCPGKSIVLKAKPGFAAYRWQNGSTADSLQVTTTGFYKVTGTDNCGQQSADSITVINSDTSLVLPAMQAICKYDTAYITLPTDVNNITWQPANDGILNNKTLSLFPRQTTMYLITVERQVNCPITKASNVVVENCTQVIFIPNAFTPNNDSRNDVFKASTFRPLQAYHLAIYNRYGQKIFDTNNLTTGWDGSLKGKPQPAGGYTYRCSYQFTGGLPQSEAGYFILVR